MMWMSSTPGRGGEVEHGLDDPLAVVGAAHLRQREAGVVEHDRQLHVGPQQRRQRVHVDRVEQARCGSRRRDRRCRQRLGWVDHPRAVGGQLLEAEPLAPPEQDRRRRAVDLEHETGTRHFSPSSFEASYRRPHIEGLRSKAILTAPRRPAAAAWAMASTCSSRRYVAERSRPRSKRADDLDRVSSKSSRRVGVAPRESRLRGARRSVRSSDTSPGMPTSTISPPGRDDLHRLCDRLGRRRRSRSRRSNPHVSWSPARCELDSQPRPSTPAWTGS